MLSEVVTQRPAQGSALEERRGKCYNFEAKQELLESYVVDYATDEDVPEGRLTQRQSTTFTR